MKILQTGEVFVPGGVPTVTYVKRHTLELDKKIHRWVKTPFKVLAVSGPTKSGKTILLERALPTSIRVSGGNVGSADDLWEEIAEQLRLPIAESSTSTTESTAEQVKSVGAKHGPLSAGLARSERQTQGGSVTHGLAASARRAVRSELAERPVPIVIDDFHYISPEVQKSIVREIKDLVLRGIPFAVAAVPHRAFDVIRAEREMTGRIVPLKIPAWSPDDLMEISVEGFAALGAEVSHEVSSRLAQEAFGSPFLMQDFCYELALHNGIDRTSTVRVRISRPLWSDFFRDRAVAIGSNEFDEVASGPQQRKARKRYPMKRQGTVDVYRGTLLALSRCGSNQSPTYDQLRTELREVLADEMPQKAQIVRAIRGMSARSSSSNNARSSAGESVIEYDQNTNQIHVTDPFFGFYLRWGAFES